MHDRLGRSPEFVTLVATVFNEVESVDAWLDGLSAQTRKPDEWVLVDAGSTDGTIEIIRRFAVDDDRVRLIVAPGINVPEGRNLAISQSCGPIIAVTDAGTLADRTWLERIVAPLEADVSLGVSAGFFLPAGRNAFEKVLAATITPTVDEIDPATLLPSSRSIAFRKHWWTTVSGYPEWLRAGEDLWFSQSLRDAGAPFAFVPDALVSWYPRPTLCAYFRQYRHYARGDGHSNWYLRRQLARFGTYASGLALVTQMARRPTARWLLAIGLLARQVSFVRRLWRHRPFADPVRMLLATAIVPVITVTGDVAKMMGYPQGRWERWRTGGAEGLKRARIRSHRSADLAGAATVPVDGSQ